MAILRDFSTIPYEPWFCANGLNRGNILSILDCFVIPTSSKPSCEDCRCKSNDVDIRTENGDYFPVDADLEQFALLKIIYLCNSCAKDRQENTVTPCMKL